MRCNLAMIKHMWDSPLVEYQGDIDFPHSIIAINRLDPSHPEWLSIEHLVFAGYDDEWKNIDKLPAQGICIIKSNDASPISNQDDTASWLMIREPFSVEEVIIRVDGYLTRLSLWEEKLQEMFAKNSELTHILNHCREILHNPLYLLDYSMQMIGYSDAERPDEFDKWLEEFSKPDGKKKVFENERRYNILELLANARKSVQIDLPVDVFPFISSTIYDGDKKMAVLGGVGCDKEMISENAAMMDYISDRLSAWIINLIRKKEIANSHLQGIVRNILFGKRVNDAVVSECARQMKIYDKRFRIIRIHLPEDVYASLKDYIWCALRNIFSDIWLMVVDDDLIVFISEKEYFDFLQEKKSSALEFANKFDIRICVSLPMDSLHYAERQYKWMDNMISLDIDSGAILTGEDHFEEILLKNCLLQSSLEQFCHPQILKILEHDRQNGSCWLLTLETFLEEERSLVGTAKKLHIHRNTLIYRIQQITNMTGFDFNDQKTRRICMLSCAVLKYRQSQLTVN